MHTACFGAAKGKSSWSLRGAGLSPTRVRVAARERHAPARVRVRCASVRPKASVTHERRHAQSRPRRDLAAMPMLITASLNARSSTPAAEKPHLGAKSKNALIYGWSSAFKLANRIGKEGLAEPRLTSESPFWLSPDPILASYMKGGPSGGVFNPKNLSLYSYAHNNPVVMRDPDGRFAMAAPLLYYAGAAAAGAIATWFVARTIVGNQSHSWPPPLTNIPPAIPVGTPPSQDTASGVPVSPPGTAAWEPYNPLLPGKSLDGLQIPFVHQASSPTIDPQSVAGKTPQEIDQIARGLGLTPKGKNPLAGQGAYIDPVTGEQRILIHPTPTAGGPHAHVNDPQGGRLDVNGKPVPAEAPEAHLPIKVK
jgi:hypothetical protein